MHRFRSERSRCGLILLHEEADFPKPASPKPPILQKVPLEVGFTGRYVEYAGNVSSWRSPSQGWVDDTIVFSISGKCTTYSATLGRCVFVLRVKRENRLSVSKAAYGVCDTMADRLMVLLREKNDGPGHAEPLRLRLSSLVKGFIVVIPGPVQISVTLLAMQHAARPKGNISQSSIGRERYTAQFFDVDTRKCVHHMWHVARAALPA